jgi:hypothetical protein
VIDLLREYTPAYLERFGTQAVPQVQSVLAKLALCRTAALGGHTYECPQCHHRCQVYNSCRDRHCPLCSGGRRADWLDKTAELILPGITYFQVVFTLPEELKPLMLGHRRSTYRLLFHAAWEALRDVLQVEQDCEPAALLVLHTWDQRLNHHPHIHAVVPGGGPSRDGERWVETGRRPRRGCDKPYLVDHRVLSGRFRDKFLAGLKGLHRNGQLKLTGPWAHLEDSAAFAGWLQPLAECDWVVFIEPPPSADAKPTQVLKYLARYLSGGPISDGRLLAHEDGKVTFWARGRDKQAGNQREPCTLWGDEFTQRWARHILPKGFVKSRCFGGFSCRNRQAYLDRCRQLLDAQRASPAPAEPSAGDVQDETPFTPSCPYCQTPMECVSRGPRVSWRTVLGGPDCPSWYDPFDHAIRWGCLDWYRNPPDG